MGPERNAARSPDSENAQVRDTIFECASRNLNPEPAVKSSVHRRQSLQLRTPLNAGEPGWASVNCNQKCNQVPLDRHRDHETHWQRSSGRRVSASSARARQGAAS